MKLNSLLKSADKNLAASIRHRINNSEKGKLYETESYMIYTIGVDNKDGHINGVLCFDQCGEDVIRKADEFFKPINRDYVFWIRDHGDNKLERILKDKGYKAKREPGSAGMIIKEKINAVSIPKGFEIKRVTNSKEVKDFALVTKKSFEKPDIVTEAMFSSDDILISPNTRAFVIYEDNRPVSAVTMTLSQEVAGIYWVGTIEEARGKGLGSYITQVSTNKAFDLGTKAVVLQASEAGERVYKKLGYETITRYRWYPIETL
ncbi:GNAT family N-acetyltransferase [Dethiothermospora halolimnae]|uniref:GNAT family N-acetyltransferase n=1 Tax=Dethiothermospora halolimnae TaxID=3114390 RepID=UPI003CCC2210